MIDDTRRDIAYFAYGTLQKGFQNWPDLADRLGDPIGRFRTVAPHALVVPLEPGCGNPGCRLLHRMAALVPGVDGFHVEGDLFMIDRATLAAVDRLEDYEPGRRPPGLYERVEVEVVALDRRRTVVAMAYRVREPARWRALATSGAAELLTQYVHDLARAEAKRCCRLHPGHDGPHDVVDPLASVRR